MAATHADTEPSRAHREDHTPDAFVYRSDAGTATWFCCDCVAANEVTTDSLFTAWHRASEHQRWTHGRRRVWIDYSNPAHAATVQMALPMVVALNTSRPRY